MFEMLFLAAAMSNRSEIPADRWVCKNDVEVWCDEEGCRTRPGDETTPLSVTAAGDRSFSVCAYTGCWESEKAMMLKSRGRTVWIADNVPFSTRPEGGFAADVTLLIVEGARDGEDAGTGVGFVRAGGLATPLICLRVGPDGEPAAPRD